MHDIREKAITKTSIIGIVVNILLSAFKAVVGLISGSILTYHWHLHKIQHCTLLYALQSEYIYFVPL